MTSIALSFIQHLFNTLLTLSLSLVPLQTVQAKRGRALIWPSVHNDNPHQKDIRTEHEALPVIKGIKYGANAWLHQRDFQTPFDRDCVE